MIGIFICDRNANSMLEEPNQNEFAKTRWKVRKVYYCSSLYNFHTEAM